MEKHAELIANLAQAAKYNQESSFDDWIKLLVSAKNPDFVTPLLTACLSPRCCAWRFQAIVFLLDVVNNGEGGYVSVTATKNAIKPMDVWKCKAADLVFGEYLRSDPETESRCCWVQDFHDSPEVYVYLLRSLRQHEDDPYMSQPNHPESAIKRFLKRCTMASRWDEREEFVKIRDQHLTELFLTLIRYDLSDLIYRTDDVALESLKAIVFGPPDEYGFPYDKAIPETLESALSHSGYSRRKAAERLIVLTAIRKAEDKDKEEKRIAAEIQHLEHQRTQLAHNPGPTPDSTGVFLNFLVPQHLAIRIEKNAQTDGLTVQ